MLQKIDVLNKLQKVRKKTFSADKLLENYKYLLNKVDAKRNETILKLNSKNNEAFNVFNIDKIDANAIFHISQIKRICADYRLRFLDSANFINPYPEELITKIHMVESLHNTTLCNFKIVAPYEAFKQKKADDPLLFAPMGNGYYHLIHKWGTDLHPLRKFKFWAFKNVETLGFALAILSILCTAISYPLFFNREPNFGYLLMLFMFYFKGVAGMFFIFFGSSGKNFSEYSWQSQYDKIR
ncbi:hypothetical protein [Polaribacter porphyrae]|uniref:Uncharacterized protein n=1 Tax=Polaribacter porphyrae TaxID=1137780 RepID=A0A2S7WLU0_9FLAO|nr:hypothetical protein [Polaribacter porphyrae]PQJ78261.1 hypothetical protein BTO18_03220 [Polaribacter porphyrae]